MNHNNRKPEYSTPSDMMTAPGYLLRRLNQAYQAAWVAHVDSTSTGAQLAVLMAIRTYPGVEQGMVGASVSLDRSTMASIVTRLVERGLIERVRPADDGRKRLLYLTKDGKIAVKELVERAQKLDGLLMEGFGPIGMEIVVGMMDSLARRWEDVADRDADSEREASS
ncbi:MarR family transcriptional regulator [Rhodococcus sp. 06-156-3C]|nr:MarR family transcriptional regulator [Rhodococcus sp. 06-156-4a]OZD18120.1 MarR family transcriptional regulator [Rhodococcus sp. 06-156-3C]OZD20457.1 MarR family transcriptional regulator [Rhodococcus sp. 06-156-4C]OZD29302.1 MarR family transcriptional regulator [Rhodococcus sp. 06-156-3]OZD30728.1 MarR family transcriptional regulator [Rhodococcus sp. 06-156-3b]OZF65091.1 MarR family transcriptional regulator [Rhodococcus sp. 06-156-4]